MIGFLFMASSPAMSNTRSQIQIAFALLVGTGLCGLYAWAGGYEAYPRFPMALVFGYFVVHELRDEGFFYRQYREAPAYTEKRSSPVRPVLIGLVLGLAALAWSFPFLRGGQETRDLSWLLDPRS
jgi:hypothetical protein